MLGKEARPLVGNALLLLFSSLFSWGIEASVFIKTSNYTLSPLPDLPADFGPSLSDSLQGQIVISDPADACQELSVPPVEGVWIALVARSQKGSPSTCSFNAKVSNAEVAGASAVLVYDNVLEALIIMAKPSGAMDPGIPSFFISEESGVLIRKLVEAGPTFGLIVPVEQGLWMSVLLSSFAGLLCVAFVVITFLFISHRQRIRNMPNQLGYRLMADEGLTAAQLRALPVIVFERAVNDRLVSSRWEGHVEGEKSDSDSSGSHTAIKGGGTRKTCAVCIEDYKDGEKLRVLPCQHRFHMECIDQWLSSRKPLCPICKWDAKEEHLVPPPSGVDIEQGEPSAALPAPPRRWRWNWGRSILQHQSPPRQPTSPVEATGRNPDAPLAQPNQLRSTPQNFPNMHAIPIEDAAESHEESGMEMSL